MDLIITPRGRIRVVHARPNAAPTPRARRPKRRDVDAPPLVLLIEDDGDVRDLVSAALRRSGCAVVLGVDGPTGLDLATEHRPDLVIVDLGLPRLDGLSVARALSAAPAHERPRIVVLSARGSDEDLAAAFEVGALDYITKPFRISSLRDRVWAALGG